MQRLVSLASDEIYNTKHENHDLSEMSRSVMTAKSVKNDKEAED